MSHSGSSRVVSAGLTNCPHALEPGRFPGFGYLLGPPNEQQRSRLGENPAAARHLLGALSQALPPCAGYWETPLPSGVHPDDNLVLAQLVALFANLHDAIAGRLTVARPEAVLGYAQLALQRIYHAVILHDLLPRILHPRALAVLRDRLATDQGWLWQSEATPLEFTHGAFRVGHAMVRTHYRFNRRAASVLPIAETLNGGAYRAEMRRPLRDTWLVEWSQFFHMIDGVTPNASRRLSPSHSALDAAGLLRSEDAAQPENLTLRDSLSAALARTWSIDALIDGIQAQGNGSIPSDWILRDRNGRREAIRKWLATRGRPGILDGAAIDTISADPPLPFFVLLESALDPAIEGRLLGPLASTIVGEVIGRSIARQRRRLDAVEPAARAAFDPAFWNEMMAIASMPDLVRFVAHHGGFDSAPVPLI